MDSKEQEIIENHLKNTHSGWFNILTRYTDGTIQIVHGTGNKSYLKTLRVKSK